MSVVVKVVELRVGKSYQIKVEQRYLIPYLRGIPGIVRVNRGEYRLER